MLAAKDVEIMDDSGVDDISNLNFWGNDPFPRSFASVASAFYVPRDSSCACDSGVETLNRGSTDLSINKTMSQPADSGEN